jgi:hypothetical protein
MPPDSADPFGAALTRTFGHINTILNSIEGPADPAFRVASFVFSTLLRLTRLDALIREKQQQHQIARDAAIESRLVLTEPLVVSLNEASLEAHFRRDGWYEHFHGPFYKEFLPEVGAMYGRKPGEPTTAPIADPERVLRFAHRVIFPMYRAKTFVFDDPDFEHLVGAPLRAGQDHLSYGLLARTCATQLREDRFRRSEFAGSARLDFLEQVAAERAELAGIQALHEADLADDVGKLVLAAVAGPDGLIGQAADFVHDESLKRLDDSGNQLDDQITDLGDQITDLGNAATETNTELEAVQGRLADANTPEEDKPGLNTRKQALATKKAQLEQDKKAREAKKRQLTRQKERLDREKKRIQELKGAP